MKDYNAYVFTAYAIVGIMFAFAAAITSIKYKKAKQKIAGKN